MTEKKRTIILITLLILSVALFIFAKYFTSNVPAQQIQNDAQVQDQ